MLPQASGGVVLQKFAARFEIFSKCPQVNSKCYPYRRSELRGGIPKWQIFRTTSNTSSLTSRSISNPNSQRSQLYKSLVELQKNASSFVNQSRLQLALRGLEQQCGEETIRIAVLGIPGRLSSFKRAKHLMKLLLADPMKPEEAWEQILFSEGSQAVILKFGTEAAGGTYKENLLVKDLQISSPLLKGRHVEIMILESDLPTDKFDENSMEALLVPSIKIPSSVTGRYNIVRTPAHRTLLISEGLLGAVKIFNFAANIKHHDAIGTAVDLQVSDDQKSTVPSYLIDVNLASQALKRFRENAIDFVEYEKILLISGLPKIQNWLQIGTLSTNNEMNVHLRELIMSMLESTRRAIDDEKARLVTVAQSKKVSPGEIARLQGDLRAWAHRSHTELRNSLQIAFEGQRWRKLSWWKLFWRVDDVSMISSDIINQRFLINAEQEAIFLAGRIEECGFCNARYSASKIFSPETLNEEISKARLGDKPTPPQLKNFIPIPEDNPQFIVGNNAWPLNILIARLYLSQRTIPSLQLQGQRLVAKTLFISSLTSMLSGLIYISSVSTSFYEAGIIATLGTLISLQRMQKNWEKARDSWEKEVREEGRRALRGVEITFDTLLKADQDVQKVEETNEAEIALEAAQKALITYK